MATRAPTPTRSRRPRPTTPYASYAPRLRSGPSALRAPRSGGALALRRASFAGFTWRGRICDIRRHWALPAASASAAGAPRSPSAPTALPSGRHISGAREPGRRNGCGARGRRAFVAEPFDSLALAQGQRSSAPAAPVRLAAAPRENAYAGRVTRCALGPAAKKKPAGPGAPRAAPAARPRGLGLFRPAWPGAACNNLLETLPQLALRCWATKASTNSATLAC